MPKRTQAQKEAFEAKKARTVDDCVPAGVRLRHDVDAMGCLIMAVTRDNRDLHEKVTACRNEMDDLKRENERLKRDVRRTEAYVTELECRMEPLEEAIKRALCQGESGIGMLGIIHDILSTNDFVEDDLKRVVDELGLQNDLEVMNGWEEWLNSPEPEDMFA